MIAASAAAPDSKQATLHPPKTNGWKLKRDQKEKEKHLQTHQFFGVKVMSMIWGVDFTISPKMSSQKHPKNSFWKKKLNNFPEILLMPLPLDPQLFAVLRRWLEMLHTSLLQGWYRCRTAGQWGQVKKPDQQQWALKPFFLKVQSTKQTGWSLQ